MHQPPGFEVSDRALVCRLNKALYGHGFQASECDPSLFLLHTNNLSIMVLVYVDDIIITGNSVSFIDTLNQKPQ